MSERDLGEQLVKYLTDVHSIEEQALTQMRRAPGIAGDPDIAEAFEQHLRETERQEQLIRERLEAAGGKPSMVKDVAGRAGGVGMVLFAKFQPDTPGKLVVHAYSYEHLEVAAYELLTRVAERAGSADTAGVAREIAAEERRMAARLEGVYDRAVAASLRDLEPDDLTDQIRKYLADAHAIEMQAIQLLERASTIAEPEALARLYEEHLIETHDHERRINERLEAIGGSTSNLKDAALRLGALNWGMFFQAQPDTPAKLAGFAYAFEHLEAAAYELLKRVATRAGDAETAAVADSILGEERAAAAKIAERWDEILDASLAGLAVSR
jgi:ferritin-like metal-binding protein YciE